MNRFLLTLLILTLLTLCQKKKYPPQLSSVSPNLAAIGSEITLGGAQFGDAPSVTLGNQTVPTKTRTDNSISLTVPRMATGPTTIRVQNADGTSDPLPFTVLQPLPQLSGVDPANGLPGTVAKLMGEFLDKLKAVRFGTAQAEISGSGNEREVTVKVPTTSRGPVKLTIETEGGQSQADFIVAATPEITSLSSTTIRVGSELTISGRNLLDGVVSLNGVVVDKAQTQVQDSQIKVIVPDAVVGTGKVSVTVFDKLVASSQQTITVMLPLPTVSSISPDKGIKDTEVTITGQNLQNVQEVKFGNQIAQVKPGSTNGKVIVSCPDFGSVQTVQITVRTGSGTSNSQSFTGAPPPTIDKGRCVPAGLISGSALTLKGSNFGTMSQVRFTNGSVSRNEFIRIENNEITLKVPAGTQSGLVQLVNEYGAGQGVQFDFVVGGAGLNSSNIATNVGAINTGTISNGCRSAAFWYCYKGVEYAFRRDPSNDDCKAHDLYSIERIGGTDFEVYTMFEHALDNQFVPKVPLVTEFWLKLQRRANSSSEFTGLVIFKLASGRQRQFIGSIVQNGNILLNAVDDHELLKLCKVIKTDVPALLRGTCTPPCN